MLMYIIVFVAGCCVGATFHVVIQAQMEKAKKKARQIANELRD